MENTTNRGLQYGENEALLIDGNPLSRLIPMTVFSKASIRVPSIYKLSSMEDMGLYCILGDEDIIFYMECSGEKDLNWILDDISCRIDIRESLLLVTLVLDKIKATFSFDLINNIQAYAAFKLLQQKELIIYYLLDKGEYYCYLGYQRLDFNQEARNEIINKLTK